MKISKLIELLSKFDGDLETGILYDGEIRLSVEIVYQSNHGDVVVTDNGQPVYSDDSRPVGYPKQSEQQYFNTNEIK